MGNHGMAAYWYWDFGNFRSSRRLAGGIDLSEKFSPGSGEGIPRSCATGSASLFIAVLLDQRSREEMVELDVVRDLLNLCNASSIGVAGTKGGIPVEDCAHGDGPATQVLYRLHEGTLRASTSKNLAELDTVLWLAYGKNWGISLVVSGLELRLEGNCGEPKTQRKSLKKKW
jgi:hypothetical protein